MVHGVPWRHSQAARCSTSAHRSCVCKDFAEASLSRVGRIGIGGSISPQEAQRGDARGAALAVARRSLGNSVGGLGRRSVEVPRAVGENLAPELRGGGAPKHWSDMAPFDFDIRLPRRRKLPVGPIVVQLRALGGRSLSNFGRTPLPGLVARPLLLRVGPPDTQGAAGDRAIAAVGARV